MSASSPVDENKAPDVQLGADDKYLVDIFAPPNRLYQAPRPHWRLSKAQSRARCCADDRRKQQEIVP